MKYLPLFALCLGLLSGCGPVYHTDYNFNAPRSTAGKTCIMTCSQNRMMCEQLNDSHCQQCRNEARQDAMYRYAEYKSVRLSQHKPIEKTLNDFQSFTFCNRGRNCDADYRACFTTCGGKVTTHTYCVSGCDKK